MSLAAAVCGCLSLLAVVPPQSGDAPAAPPPGRVDAAHWVRELERPGHELAAVRELVQLGPEALPALHKALATARPQTAPLVLFACSGMTGELESLREPIRRHLGSKHLGVALAARDAWLALDGGGRTLVGDRQGLVSVVDATGHENVLRSRHGLLAVGMLPEGHVLCVDCRARRVLELDASGAEVWTSRVLTRPSDAERLPDGNTLVADPGEGRVVELDRDGREVWSWSGGGLPLDVDRVADGNTLIASYRTGVVEVDRAGRIVWQWANANARDADRLPDGTTLITCSSEQRVVLMNRAHERVAEWRVGGAVEHLDEADLLPNGNLLVTGSGGVVELEPGGREVWRVNVLLAARAMRLGSRSGASAGR